MTGRRVDCYEDGAAHGGVLRIREILSLVWPDGSRVSYVGWTQVAEEVVQRPVPVDLLDARPGPPGPREVALQKQWMGDLCLSWALLRQTNEILEALKLLNDRSSTKVLDGFSDRAMMPHCIDGLVDAKRIIDKILRRIKPFKFAAGR